MALRVLIQSPAGDQFRVKPSEVSEWQGKGCTIVGMREVEESYKPTKAQLKARNFAAANQSLVFDGWTTQTASIDYYLREKLVSLRARSREQAVNNPLMKRGVNVIAKNVVGAKGITVHPKVKQRNGQLDKPANSAIKAAFADWSYGHCDYLGKMSFVELQNLWLKTAAVDGEFLFRTHMTGKYGLQIENIDPELLDLTRNQKETNGNVTRLGVERSGGMVVAYWFRQLDEQGNYYRGRSARIPAKQITHCFIPEWPNQSRGIPWAVSSLTRLKHLDALDEAALIAFRAGASKMGFIKGGDDDDDELDDGLTTMDFSPGTIEKLTDEEEFIGFDPTYPSDSYEPVAKKGMRDVGAGMDISYASLSGDMSDVNYSSIRYGGQDEREGFIDKQNWLIRCAIRPIYESFIRNAVLREQITISGRPLSRPVTDYYPAHFQGRRWLSTDPQKEAKGHEMDIQNGLTSPQRIIAARGDDPDEILEEIQEWRQATGVANEQVQESNARV